MPSIDLLPARSGTHELRFAKRTELGREADGGGPCPQPSLNSQHQQLYGMGVMEADEVGAYTALYAALRERGVEGVDNVAIQDYGAMGRGLRRGARRAPSRGGSASLR
eukprot:GGOE01059716.1.p2 GENE.GGOE01059716.1~~GGOE01059716.1.p2  ORF type:complete len:108 (+),score=6.27 GGOE01059716.1:2-325(+)